MIAAVQSGLWHLRHNTARPDILAAYELQPVEPLLVSQADGFCNVVHGGFPADAALCAAGSIAQHATRVRTV